MALDVFTVEDLKDVVRSPEKITLVDDPSLPAFFFLDGGTSRFFFINLFKFIDPVTGKIDSDVIETEADLPKNITKIDAAAPLTYYGFALPTTLESAAAWRILREEDLGDGDFDFLYAGGVDTFVHIWDNRAALAYS